MPNKRIFKLNNLKSQFIQKKAQQIRYFLFFFSQHLRYLVFNEKFFDYKKFDNFNLINIDFLLKIFKFIGNSEEKFFLCSII